MEYVLESPARMFALGVIGLLVFVILYALFHDDPHVDSADENDESTD